MNIHHMPGTRVGDERCDCVACEKARDPEDPFNGRCPNRACGRELTAPELVIALRAGNCSMCGAGPQEGV